MFTWAWMMFTWAPEKEPEQEGQPLEVGWEQSHLEAKLAGADVKEHLAMIYWGQPAASWVCDFPSADLKQQYSLW